jgi:CubicO group peptidase (beta-lactamase class C family)
MLMTLAASLVLFVAGADAPVGGTPRLTDAVRRAIETEIAAAAAEGFSGAVAVRVEAEPAFTSVAGHADRQGRVPVTASTLFQVASISKYFAAAATLKLVERGRLSLDDPLSKYLDGLPVDHGAIRVRELLDHTSGLANAYAAEGIADRDGALAALGKVPIDAARRGRFGYSNDGYEFLAILVEVISGKPYEQFVHAELLEPAGVSGIRYWSEADLTDPHIVAQCLAADRPGAELRARNYGVLGSAAVLATPTALIDWQLALWSGKVLSATSRDEMFKERLEVSIGSAGYGVFIAHSPTRGRRLLARGYEDWGANAVLSHWPEAGVAIAVVTSTGPAESTGHPGWSRTLTDAIADRVLGPP